MKYILSEDRMAPNWSRLSRFTRYVRIERYGAYGILSLNCVGSGRMFEDRHMH